MNTAKMLPGPVLGTWFDGVLFEEFVLDDGGLVVPEVELDELVEPEVDFWLVDGVVADLLL